MPSVVPLLSRRTTLVAAPLVTLAACEWGPPQDRTTASPAPPADTGPDDSNQVAEALASMTAVAELVARVAAEHRRLARHLADLTALHLAHSRLLQDGAEPSAPPTPPTVPTNRRRAMALVLSEEQALQDTLLRLAVGVGSGTLARALASMSAAVAQQLAVLPEGGAA